MRKALLLGRTNERLVVVCLFSNLPTMNKKGRGNGRKRYKKKTNFRVLQERGKKEEVRREMRRERKKKEKFPKAKQNLPKIRSPSLLSWRERVCVCARV